jgi:ABC-2 type transport system permease protein
MSAAFAIARKEIRALFQSPVAVIFLGVFLLVTLFTFFSWSKFFARNLADVRPFFEWLPLLLIGLVSAIAMRAWAEERKAGTLEVLLTLPVSTRDLVIGKFLAGMALVATGLLLTVPLPLVVNHLGNLDWGPVIGGYLAAFLLAGAYMAIGLCISSRTDNQVVALLLTAVVGGGLYLIGTDRLASLFGNEGAEIVRLLGTGSRFQSVERGVVDVRDLAYYAGITISFLVLNGYFLERMRLDPGSARGRSRGGELLALVGLAAANALVANLWLAPLASFRLDLTEGGEYSLSPVTRNTLRGLDEQLVILGLFSERTHPLLAPLIPQIRDQLAEIQLAGGDKVKVVIEDPNEDPDLEQEVGEAYGVRPVPFGVSDRHSQSVVNSYFHLVVKYGDQYQVLDFSDLIDVSQNEDSVDVRLKNFEYDLTKTIRKVSQEFTSVDALLAKLPPGSSLTVYASPGTLPEGFQATATSLRKISSDLAQRSSGHLAFSEVDPSKDPALGQKLVDELGLQPMVTDLFAQEVFWLYGVIRAGDRVERIIPQPGEDEADLRRAIEGAVRRVTPGQLRRVALYTEVPPQEQPNPQLPPQFQPPQRHEDYNVLREVLGQTWEVEASQLEDGIVPSGTDVLIVGKTGPTEAKQRYAIDQYLMQGGSVVALAGRFHVEIGQGGITPVPDDPSLGDLLKTWFVHPGDGMVMDTSNAPFPIPVQERRGQFTVQRVQLLPYPPFPDVRGAGLAEHPALAGIDALTTPWASPVVVDTPHEGVETQVLLTTSSGSWVDATGRIEPDFAKYPDAGFAPEGPLAPQVVAVAATGVFPSNFAGAPSPLAEDAPKPLEKSVAPGKLVVIGSSELVADLMMQLASQPNGEVHRGNLQLISNLVDWSTADTELLSIRSSGAFSRTLKPMEESDRQFWEWSSYAAVLLPLGALIAATRARRATPIALVEA